MSKKMKLSIAAAVIIGIVIGVVIAVIMMNVYSKGGNPKDSSKSTREDNKINEERIEENKVDYNKIDEEQVDDNKINEEKAVKASTGVRGKEVSADSDKGQSTAYKSETSKQSRKSISSADLMFPLFPGEYGYDSSFDINHDGAVDRFEYIYINEYYDGYFDDHGQYFTDEEAQILATKNP